MTDPIQDRDLQKLWQSQTPSGPAISLDEIRQKAQRFERKVARRNLREYVAAAVVVAGFGVVMWVVPVARFGVVMWVVPSATVRVGAGLLIAAAIAVAYMLHLWGTATTLPSDLALRSALEFHRAQLERQRDLLRSVWLWYLLPFAPGLLVLLIGLALAHPDRGWRIIPLSLVMIVFMAGVYELNRRAAARIQRRIDRLKENL